jgi:hypothetical protein
VGVGQLKAEPRNDAEVARLLAMARTRLVDARLKGASAEGRFTSAYSRDGGAHCRRGQAGGSAETEAVNGDLAEMRSHRTSF